MYTSYHNLRPLGTLQMVIAVTGTKDPVRELTPTVRTSPTQWLTVRQHVLLLNTNFLSTEDSASIEEGPL